MIIILLKKTVMISTISLDNLSEFQSILRIGKNYAVFKIIFEIVLAMWSCRNVQGYESKILGPNPVGSCAVLYFNVK